MAKKTFLILGIIFVIFLGIIFFSFGSKDVSSLEAVSNFEDDMVIYKSGSCGCCGVYSTYFKSKGNPKINVVDLQDLQAIKTKYGIPSAMESCHTTIMGNYFVEGHVPLEAVNKLLTEKPDIKGIAMPGMPSGSPGMPGAKTGDFVIYAVNNDGSYTEWMRL
ncbi:hypothetical protein J4413_01835 [Candidatus Woesearchaeota archaeon]|nr:hypothetical protein [Candidatus Woesearchaeota archaeon]